MTNDPTTIQRVMAAVPWEQVIAWVSSTLVPILMVALRIMILRLARANKTVEAMVVAVDKVPDAAGEQAASKVKQLIQKEAVKAGVEDHLSDTVTKVKEKAL